jgi:hypothetical protein
MDSHAPTGIRVSSLPRRRSFLTRASLGTHTIHSRGADNEHANRIQQRPSAAFAIASCAGHNAMTHQFRLHQRYELNDELPRPIRLSSSVVQRSEELIICSTRACTSPAGHSSTDNLSNNGTVFGGRQDWRRRQRSRTGDSIDGGQRALHPALSQHARKHNPQPACDTGLHIAAYGDVRHHRRGDRRVASLVGVQLLHLAVQLRDVPLQAIALGVQSAVTKRREHAQ